MKWLKINTLTLVSFYVFFLINQKLFATFFINSNISWIFLPAGLRLFVVLIYRHQGLVGLFLGSLIASIYLNHEPLSLFTLTLALASTANPLIALYVLEKWIPHLKIGLENLMLKHILSLAIIQAFFCSILHHLIFLYFDKTLTENLLSEMLAMFFGDLIGIILIMFVLTLIFKAILWYRRMN